MKTLLAAVAALILISMPAVAAPCGARNPCWSPFQEKSPTFAAQPLFSYAPAWMPGEPEKRLTRKRGRKFRGFEPSQNAGFGFAGSFSTISKPARYVAGRLICAVNVNLALAERGIRGTGSAMAKSFLGWGRASAPVPGAVAVSGRRGGGHVAIVSRVENGRVFVWNPSARGRGWREVEYRHRAISYRVPG